MKHHGLLHENSTYLISYPRSGANWLRYCVENITEQITLGVKPAALGCDPLTPLDNSVEFAIQKLLNEEMITGKKANQVPIMQHSHRWFCAHSTTRILFLIRNPKEAILRDLRGTIGSDQKVKQCIQHNPIWVLITPDGICDYASLAKRYVEHTGPKHIVYYEDLKSNPEETLIECTKFLTGTDTTKNVKSFMEKFSYHNERSVKIYSSGVAKSYTKGSTNNTLHSDQFMSESDKKRWDKYLIKNHPTIVPVVERYFEK